MQAGNGLSAPADLVRAQPAAGDSAGTAAALAGTAAHVAGARATRLRGLFGSPSLLSVASVITTLLALQLLLLDRVTTRVRPARRST